jgi:Zn-dependent peptidase ImmA (M78 family)
MKISEYKHFLKMKQSYKEMQPANIKRSAIAKYAEEMAKEIKLTTDTSLFDVVKRNDGKVHLFGVLDLEAEDGTLFVHKDRTFDVLVPQWQGPISDRFYLAHELGHYIMHCPKDETVEGYWTNYRNDTRLDCEANWFALSFLIAEEDFRTSLEKGMNDFSLSAHFLVPTYVIEAYKEWMDKKDAK